MSDAFGPHAARLAGMAGRAFGWSPDRFWAATPAELAALVAGAEGEGAAVPPDAAAIRRLMEAHPDG